MTGMTEPCETPSSGVLAGGLGGFGVGGLPGPRLALVVAVGSYEDPALERLEATARDAEQMREVLADLICPELSGQWICS